MGWHRRQSDGGRVLQGHDAQRGRRHHRAPRRSGQTRVHGGQVSLYPPCFHGKDVMQVTMPKGGSPQVAQMER